MTFGLIMDNGIIIHNYRYVASLDEFSDAEKAVLAAGGAVSTEDGDYEFIEGGML